MRGGGFLFNHRGHREHGGKSRAQPRRARSLLKKKTTVSGGLFSVGGEGGRGASVVVLGLFLHGTRRRRRGP